MSTDRIDRPEARRLAEEEFERFAELTAALTPDEWAGSGCSSAARRRRPSAMPATRWRCRGMY